MLLALWVQLFLEQETIIAAVIGFGVSAILETLLAILTNVTKLGLTGVSVVD